MSLGGLKEYREFESRDVKLFEAIDHIKSTLQKESGKEFKSIVPVSYRVQVVSGLNFFVKVRVSSEDGEELKHEYAHLRIYVDLGEKVSLTSFQMDKKEDDRLEYF